MPDLLVERHGHVTVFTLNRPDKLNALGSGLSHELATAMARVRR